VEKRFAKQNLWNAAFKQYVTVSFWGLRHAATYSHTLTGRACRFWAGGAVKKTLSILNGFAVLLSTRSPHFIANCSFLLVPYGAVTSRTDRLKA
jgi:hypothetical protein